MNNKVNYACAFSQSETEKYFEWINSYNNYFRGAQKLRRQTLRRNHLQGLTK